MCQQADALLQVIKHTLMQIIAHVLTKKKKKIPGNNVNQNKASDITEKVSNELSFSAEASGLRLHRTCIILQ